jgi:phosphatidylglycerol:prolipoprotein diacylglycerol transferase
MHPILFPIGPFTVYTYGVMLVIAFTVATWLAARAARRLPPTQVAINAQQLVDFASVSLLGGIIGGRLVYVLLHWDAFLQSPQDIVAIWHGGLVWYGGFLGGVLAGWCYVRATRLHFFSVMDQVIPFVALGHAIGRVGCFLNGCCYGKVTEAWCGVVFPGQPLPVLPTQLIEAGGLFVLFSGLCQAAAHPWVLSRPGRLSGVYLISYAGLRFAIEFWRGDQAVLGAGLTLQQLVSMVMLLVGLWLVSRRPVFS